MNDDIRPGVKKQPTPDDSAPAQGGANPFAKAPSTAFSSSNIHTGPTTVFVKRGVTCDFSSSNIHTDPTTSLTPSADTTSSNLGNIDTTNVFGGAGNITPSTPMTGTQVKKKSPLKWILGIGIPFIIIVGVLVWYFAFVNNKVNIVRDALYSMMATRDNSIKYKLNISGAGNTIKLDGNVDYLASGKAAITANIDGKVDGQDMNIGTVSAMSDGDKAYVKLDLSDRYNTLFSMMGVDIDGQWISISKDDLKNAMNNSSSSLTSSISTSVSTSDKASPNVDPEKVLQCYSNMSDQLDDRATQQQIVDALIDTEFLVIGDNGKDDRGGYYDISFDGEHFGDFYKKIVNTDLVQSMVNCFKDNGIDFNTSIDDDSLEQMGESIDESNTSFRLYIKGMFNHEATALTLNSRDNGVTTKLSMDFSNTAPSIDTPSDAKSLTDVMSEISELQSTLNSSSSTSNNQALDLNLTNMSTDSDNVSSGEWTVEPENGATITIIDQ